MNERIRQLAEQSKKYALDTMIKIVDKEEALKVYSESYDTKFAELIIADCLKMCKKIWINVNLDDTILIHTTAVGTPDYNRGRMDCHDNIKEHFGIKK